MKNLSNAFARNVREADRPERVSRLRENWRMARAAHAELIVLGMPRVNVLLTGPDPVIEDLLDVLIPDLREPVGRWSPGEQLLLPPAELIGTMIFQDVGALSFEDQARLLEWLKSAAGLTQVVSTTTVSLMPHIEAGAFIEALYYRLNIICVDAA